MTKLSSSTYQYVGRLAGENLEDNVYECAVCSKKLTGGQLLVCCMEHYQFFLSWMKKSEPKKGLRDSWKEANGA